MNLTVAQTPAIQSLKSSETRPAQPKPETPAANKSLISIDKNELKGAAAGALVGASAVYIPLVGIAQALKPLIGGSLAQNLIAPFQSRGLVGAIGVGAGIGALAGAVAASSADNFGEGLLRGGGAGMAMGAVAGGVFGALVEGWSLGGAIDGAVKGAVAGGVIGAASGLAATGLTD